jgi:hypothetical protein
MRVALIVPDLVFDMNDWENPGRCGDSKQEICCAVRVGDGSECIRKSQVRGAAFAQLVKRLSCRLLYYFAQDSHCDVSPIVIHCFHSSNTATAGYFEISPKIGVVNLLKLSRPGMLSSRSFVQRSK